MTLHTFILRLSHLILPPFGFFLPIFKLILPRFVPFPWLFGPIGSMP
ncbi:MAG: hypothetical protein ACOYNS_16475 [Bacteroidota bacterium]